MEVTSRLVSFAVGCSLAVTAHAQTEFVNWESPHVHPLEMTPDGTRLLAVNTADDRLEIFDLTSVRPAWLGSVQVGLDPVSVRAVSNSRAWVVNHISDTISVVDLGSRSLVDTIHTPDEPCDVIVVELGGGRSRAFVSCAQPDLVQTLKLEGDRVSVGEAIPILGEDPKAMAISPDRSKIYVAIHTSGNKTTILNGGNLVLPNIVSDPAGPYGGANPPPNAGPLFDPPVNPALPLPPPVGLIVRKGAGGQWLDDNGGDWSAYVDGALAPSFGRLTGWDLYDHDVAIIDTVDLSVEYATGAMTAVMAVAVQNNPGGHGVTVVGTESTNEIRYEPVLNGRFVRVMGALVDPATATTVGAVDLNPELVAAGYANSTEPQGIRNSSLGDPRGLVWDSTGSLGWVTGMGSNNVAKITSVGARLATIEVGSGPTGVVLDEARIRVYVLNKFTGSVSVIDASTDEVLSETRFFDPTPLATKRGRKHLYDTHRTSGLGQASCASCHIDGKKDRLAWDLGNPAGDLKVVHGDNIDYEMSPVVPTNSTTFHPMKGPMTTQTLQDIIGKEPFHWRGDRLGIEEFNGAFTGLLGDDQLLSAAEMQEFEDFLASIWVPPNPFRAKTNALRRNVDLAQLDLHFKDPNTGAVTPLSTGDARRGLDLYMPTLGIRQDGLHCVTCHTNDVGIGADYGFDTTANQWVPMPIGPHGEIHSMLNSADPNTQRPLKIPQLRDMHQKTGFDLLAPRNTQGFGYTHDGAVDTISHFLSEVVFNHTPGNEVQDVADLAALMLSYSGSGMPNGDVFDPDVPPGPLGKNSHAGVGFQWTLRGPELTKDDIAIVNEMFVQEAAAPDDIAIVAIQNSPRGQVGWYHAGGFVMQSDRASHAETLLDMLASIAPGKEATFLVVPDGTEVRIAVDRDADGWFDGDEARLGTDSADPFSFPPGGAPCTATVPSAPTAATATVVDPHNVTVTWVDAAANEAGFVIERSWSDSPQWEIVGDVAAGASTFVDESVAPSTGYVYRVRSFNCAGHSGHASTGVVTTPGLGPVTSVHIHAIELNMYEIASGTGAYGTFQIVDDQGRNVAGVQVDITVVGPTVGGLTAVTNDQGQALFVTPTTTIPNPSWTFSIAAVGTGDPGIFHDAAGDNETSESVP